jgi:hypothetical protein
MGAGVVPYSISVPISKTFDELHKIEQDYSKMCLSTDKPVRDIGVTYSPNSNERPYRTLIDIDKRIYPFDKGADSLTVKTFVGGP